MSGVQEGDARRRLTAKGQATRDRIVAAAARLTLERGVAGTSVDDVKAAAGVSSSQLYHYFADKQALIRAVVAAQSETVLGLHEPYLSRLDSVEALRAWRDFVVDLTGRLGYAGGCPIGSLASGLAECDSPAREDVRVAFARWEGAIRDGLRAMAAAGELALDADPDRLALALLAALQGGLLLSQLRREGAPLEAALDAMIDRIAGLAGAPA